MSKSAIDWRVSQGIPDTRMYSGTELDKLLDAFAVTLCDNLAKIQAIVWRDGNDASYQDDADSILSLREILPNPSGDKKSE